MQKSLLLFMAFPLSADAALSVSIISYDETCGQQNGMLVAQAYNGVPPYTYLWSTGSANDTIQGLNEGWYTVQATDDAGTVASAQIYLSDGPLELNQSGWTAAGGLPCPGLCNGGFSVPLEAIYGQPPYTLGLSIGYVADPSYPHPLFAGFCDMEPITLTVTDATGCSGTLDLFIDGPNAPPILVTNVNGACNGLANGSALLWMPQETAWDPNYFVQVRAPNNQVVGGYSGAGPAQVPVSGLLPGVYTIERTHSGTWDGCLNTATFEIPDAGNTCGTVSGVNWYDVDGDCALDAGEVGIPFHVLEVQPGPEYAITSGDGHYSYNLQNGNYTLAQTDPALTPICPAVQPVPFTVNNSAPVIDLADGSTIPLDLAVNGAQGNASPGFAYALYANVVNPTPQASGMVTVVCTFDASLTYVNASPTPTNVAGNVITWDLPALGSFGTHQVSVGLIVPPGTPLGTLLNSSFIASNTLTEASTMNNAISLTSTVIGSYDPNTKEARTSTGLSATYYYIDQDEWIDYTIRFQNTGTAAAIDVVVTDTIPAELDMASFQQGVASHTFEVSFKPGRVVEWRFANINLPDSTTDEAASHGLVSFRIKPIEPLTMGTVIENIANIYFDFNDPVITEPSMLVAEFSTSVRQQGGSSLHVFPNPVNDVLRISSNERMEAIAIMASDGRIVMRRSVKSSAADLDISVLSPGAYTIAASMSNTGLAYHRFVKH